MNRRLGVVKVKRTSAEVWQNGVIAQQRM